MSRLVQGNCDDVKGFIPEHWKIVQHSDLDRHVIVGNAQVIDSDIGLVDAHLVEA